MGEGRKRGRPFEQRPGGMGPAPADEPASAVTTQEPGAGATGGFQRQAEARGGNALLRLWWMMAGNAVLLFAAVYVVMAGGWRLSLADLVYWAAVVTLLGARFLDISRCRGTTASGGPATMSHWRRYAVLLLLLSVAMWAGAHLVARVSAA
ncbi:MAG: hypothetical protein HY906_20585 [Deltaproteobacteria bacterium]|nr:hypothetical protein [Deltaproteobacteria bacterium]